MQPPVQPFQQPAATPFVQQTPATQPIQQPTAPPQFQQASPTQPAQSLIQETPQQPATPTQPQQTTAQPIQPQQPIKQKHSIPQQPAPVAAQAAVSLITQTPPVTQQPAPTQHRRTAQSRAPFVPPTQSFTPVVAHVGRAGSVKTIPWGYQAQQNLRYDNFKENYHSGPYMLFLLLGSVVFFISLIGTLLSFKVYLYGFAPMFYVGVVLGGVLAFVGFNRWINSRGAETSK